MVAPRSDADSNACFTYVRKVPRSRASRKVISLDEVRQRLRLAGYQTRIAGILEQNRDSLTRLFSTSAVFSLDGGRAGRDLLLAREQLLRVVALLRELSGDGLLPPPRKEATAIALYVQIDSLLVKVGALTERSSKLLAKLDACKDRG